MHLPNPSAQQMSASHFTTQLQSNFHLPLPELYQEGKERAGQASLQQGSMV
jgi:hypothetical protein